MRVSAASLPCWPAAYTPSIALDISVTMVMAWATRSGSRSGISISCRRAPCFSKKASMRSQAATTSASASANQSR
jgi:hypothetical protein